MKDMTGSHDEFLTYITFSPLDLSCPSCYLQFSTEAKGLIIMNIYMTGSPEELIIYITFFLLIYHALAVGTFNGNDSDLYNKQVNTLIKISSMFNLFCLISLYLHYSSLVCN